MDVFKAEEEMATVSSRAGGLNGNNVRAQGGVRLPVPRGQGSFEMFCDRCLCLSRSEGPAGLVR